MGYRVLWIKKFRLPRINCLRLYSEKCEDTIDELSDQYFDAMVAKLKK